MRQSGGRLPRYPQRPGCQPSRIQAIELPASAHLAQHSMPLAHHDPIKPSHRPWWQDLPESAPPLSAETSRSLLKGSSDELPGGPALAEAGAAAASTQLAVPASEQASMSASPFNDKVLYGVGVRVQGLGSPCISSCTMSACSVECWVVRRRQAPDWGIAAAMTR